MNRAARDLSHVAALVGLLACEKAVEAPVPPESSTAATGGSVESALAPTFIDVDIRNIYQTLLLNGLASFEKAEVWSRYYKQRWVRWCGLVTHVRKDALWIRHMDSTVTYDVLLKTARRPGQPPAKVQAGRFYNYVGRLERYDDGFHTLYLEQGVAFDAGPDGVPGMFATEPPLSRKLPGPPKVVPPPAQ